MGLLQQINEKNGAAQQEAQSAQAAVEANDRKPDATIQARQKRADFSQAMASAPDEEMGEEEASPEEQEIYTKLEMQIVDLINGPKGNELLKVIKATADPVEGIGLAAHDTIKLIDMQNPDTDREILAALGESAVEQIVEAYEDIDPGSNLNEDQMAEAYSIAVQEWMKGHPDEVDPDMKEYLAGPPPAQM